MTDKALVPPLYVSIDQVRHNPELQKLVLTGEIIVAYMSQRALDVITAPTPKEIIQQRKGPGGVMLNYVPHVYYREKLAAAYGYDYSWVADVQIDWDHNVVTAKGTLTVRIRNPLTGELVTERVATGCDGQAITMKQGGGPLDIGNDMKTVDSNAFKIACKNLGFFADLYRDEDQRSLAEIEADLQSPSGQVIEGQATQAAPAYVCANCRREIQPGTTKSGKPFTAEDMATISHERYGVPLCQSCYADRVRSDRQKADADGQGFPQNAQNTIPQGEDSAHGNRTSE